MSWFCMHAKWIQKEKNKRQTEFLFKLHTRESNEPFTHLLYKPPCRTDLVDRAEKKKYNEERNHMQHFTTTIKRRAKKKRGDRYTISTSIWYYI